MLEGRHRCQNLSSGHASHRVGNSSRRSAPFATRDKNRIGESINDAAPLRPANVGCSVIDTPTIWRYKVTTVRNNHEL